MVDEWLSLSEVASILGVHPSTVRSWSDQGHLPAHRTQGGHRRFRRSEVELWIQTHRDGGVDEGHLVMQAALKNIRMQVSEGTLENERDRKSTRLNSSHSQQSRMPSSA